MSTRAELPNFLAANMALLKKYHRHIWQSLEKSPPPAAGEVFISPSGELNLRVKAGDAGDTIVMHGLESPASCGDGFLSTVPEKSRGFVAALGMGLGYGVTAIINKRPDIRHLVVLERNPGIFIQAMRHVDLSPLLSNPRVILSVTPDPDLPTLLAPARRALMLEDIHTLRHLPSFTLDPEGYNDLNDRLFQIFNKANVEGNTNLYHGRTYLKNRFANLKVIHHHFLIDNLHNQFSEVPAILVAGGPSLDKNINQLKNAAGRAVIIAVDSTLPSLLGAGVIPDFITTIDPQDLIFEKFADVVAECANTSIITMPWVSNKVTRVLPAKKIFWAFTASSLEASLAGLLGGHVLTGGAATVAHLNLQAAMILGCSPIIFVGQDLAYTDNLDHAGNTALTQKETMDLALGSGDGIVWADSVTGGKVATNRSFFEMKCHFEKMIEDAGENYEFINATEGGVDIRGTAIMSLEEAIGRYCRRDQGINARIHPDDSDSRHPDPGNLLTAYKGLLERINALLKTIKHNIRRHKQAMHELRKINRKGTRITPQTVPETLQKLLNAIDQCHKGLDRETDIWRLMQEITLQGIKDSEREKQHLKSIENDPERYHEWLTGSLRCLETINGVRREALVIFRNAFEETIKFHNREKRLLSRLPGGGDKDGVMALARFYYRDGQATLLDSVIDSMTADDRDSAEAHYYRGVIDAYWKRFGPTDEHFAAAMRKDPSYREKINRFREKMAEEYRVYGRNWIIDVKSRRRMLIKGLRYHPEYRPLVDDIQTLADADLKVAGDPSIASPHLDHDDLIRSWCRDIKDNMSFADNLRPGQITAFYRHLIRIQRRDNDIAGALGSYSRVLALNPDDPGIHHEVAELLFGIGEFAQGLRHLDRAVALDPSYASLWEKIGDDLFGTGQYEEAITAYEKCFTALPDRHASLKKIGDCHLALDHPEAAKAAYLALKGKITAAASAQH